MVVFCYSNVILESKSLSKEQCMKRFLTWCVLGLLLLSMCSCMFIKKKDSADQSAEEKPASVEEEMQHQEPDSDALRDALPDFCEMAEDVFSYTLRQDILDCMAMCKGLYSEDDPFALYDFLNTHGKLFDEIKDAYETAILLEFDKEMQGRMTMSKMDFLIANGNRLSWALEVARLKTDSSVYTPAELCAQAKEVINDMAMVFFEQEII